jgi:lipopolysaccharide transport system permease protein
LHTEIVIRPQNSLTTGWREIWQYRELLYFFTWKEIKVRYKQAFLGVLWTLLQPLSMMLIFVLIFFNGLGLQIGSIPAPLYYLSGLLIWNLFNQSITGAANSMVGNANIIKKIYFPRLIIPISAILTASFDFGISLLVLIAFSIYYNLVESINIDIFPLIVSFGYAYLITIVLAFGIGTLLSAINVKYRDVRYALPFFIQSLFFITPVMFDNESLKTPFLKAILTINPLHHAISTVRNTIESGYLDLSNISWAMLVILFLIVLTGLFVFRKTEAYFADIA